MATILQNLPTQQKVGIAFSGGLDTSAAVRAQCVRVFGTLPPDTAAVLDDLEGVLEELSRLDVDGLTATARYTVLERLETAARRQSAVSHTVVAGLGGRERSVAEYAALLAPAGLAIATVEPLGFEFSLVEVRVAASAAG